MTQIALLDADGVLTGFAPLAEAPKAGAVTVPDGCDLATDGRYMWRHGAFWPIARSADEGRILLRDMMANYRAGLTGWSQKTLVWIYETYGGTADAAGDHGSDQ